MFDIQTNADILGEAYNRKVYFTSTIFNLLMTGKVTQLLKDRKIRQHIHRKPVK